MPETQVQGDLLSRQKGSKRSSRETLVFEDLSEDSLLRKAHMWRVLSSRPMQTLPLDVNSTPLLSLWRVQGRPAYPLRNPSANLSEPLQEDQPPLRAPVHNQVPHGQLSSVSRDRDQGVQLRCRDPAERLLLSNYAPVSQSLRSRTPLRTRVPQSLSQSRPVSPPWRQGRAHAQWMYEPLWQTLEVLQTQVSTALSSLG